MQRMITLLSNVRARTARTIAAVMALACISSVVAGLARSQAARTPTVLPQPEPQFSGKKIGRAHV